MKGPVTTQGEELALWEHPKMKVACAEIETTLATHAISITYGIPSNLAARVMIESLEVFIRGLQAAGTK
jgi:hypothetical protein